MPLHLIKLCVGCSSSEELAGWIKQRMKQRKARGEKLEHIHTTRMAPKRAEELLDGGSLYWVIKGQIAAREKLRDIRPFTDKDGEKKLVVTPETAIVTFAPGDRAEVKPGTKIFIVAAQKQPDGSFQATRVSYGRDGLTPPM